MRKVELSLKEKYKYEIIKKLIETNGNKERARIKLKLKSIRQINRLIDGYNEFGKEFFVHGNRGRKPKHALTDEFKDETAVTTSLSLKQIIIRFILVSIGLVISSILITYVTDIIAARLNLGASLAGALLLGIATSLPELTSCVSLVKIGNFNVSVGNIVGSNLFNFLIIFVSDVLFIGGTVYDFAESQTRNLVIFGIISTILMLTVLKIKDKVKNKYILYIPSIGIIVSYLLFMIA